MKMMFKPWLMKYGTANEDTCRYQHIHFRVKKLIRDPKDQPILNAAMLANVDLLITGDKDFLSLDLEQPLCLTAAQFLENY